jgi:hypothetical protein
MKGGYFCWKNAVTDVGAGRAKMKDPNSSKSEDPITK